VSQRHSFAGDHLESQPETYISSLSYSSLIYQNLPQNIYEENEISRLVRNTSFFEFDRTIDIIMASFSLPWKPSTVEISTSFNLSSLFFNILSKTTCHTSCLELGRTLLYFILVKRLEYEARCTTFTAKVHIEGFDSFKVRR